MTVEALVTPKAVCINEPVCITLKQILAKEPCGIDSQRDESPYGFGKLLLGLNKQIADDEPLTFSRIAQINGPLDAFWCVCVLGWENLLVREFVAQCLERVQPHFEKTAQVVMPGAEYEGLVRETIQLLRVSDWSQENFRAAESLGERAKLIRVLLLECCQPELLLKIRSIRQALRAVGEISANLIFNYHPVYHILLLLRDSLAFAHMRDSELALVTYQSELNWQAKKLIQIFG